MTRKMSLMLVAIVLILSSVLPVSFLTTAAVTTTPVTPDTPLQAGAGETAPQPASSLTEGEHRVTLITGDVIIVSVDSAGKKSYAVSPADPTNLGQNFQVLSFKDDTYVFPPGADPSGEGLDMELFNVDYLAREGYGDDTSLPLLITYKPALAAAQTQTLRQQVAALAQDVIVHSSISTMAASIPLDNLAASYQTLLAQPDIEKIWLDRKVHATLRDSVPLISAPDVWAGGYTGAGQRIAILDTGIDNTHPDLDDLDDDPATSDPKVTVQVNFSDDPGPQDLFGHGTHVAGIAAGTGSLPLPWDIEGSTHLTTDPAEDRDGTWSPDGAQIAFSSYRGGNSDIWIMNADGSGQAKLIDLPTTVDFQPDWSPDGSMIVFDRGGGTPEEHGIWTVEVSNPAGTLTRVSELGGRPTWSGDGSEILFYRSPDTSWYGGDIWAINVNGDPATLRQITTNSATDWYPAWSPNGEIAFLSDRGNGGAEKWRFATGGAVTTRPVVEAKGGAIFGSDDGKLYDVKPDGTLAWSFTTGGPVKGSPVIGGDGSVYFGSDDGNLYAVKRDGGGEIWRFTTGGPIRTAPILAKDIFFGSDDHNLYMVGYEGKERWRFTTGGAIRSSPAIGENGLIHLGSDDGKFYALNPDGSVKWSYNVGSPIRSSPVIGKDGAIYFGSDDGKLYALKADGNLLWSFTTGGPVHGIPTTIFKDGAIYFGSDDGNLYAVRPDGSEWWHFTTGGPVRSSPVIMDMYIRFGSNDGNLYSLYNDGKEQWRFTTGGPVAEAPAVAPDGTVYIGSDDNNLYALNPSSWALWRVAAAGEGAGAATRVADKAVPFSKIEWSPDGSRIAFAGTFQGNGDIWTINPDGSGRAPVTSHGAWETDPTWSPDGNQIAFTSQRSGNQDIWKVTRTDKRNKGVAPGANLWNVKVLNRKGSGQWSWIINGVEFASLGPDGVAASGDEADVINLSLGGKDNGDGTDPLSRAVDRAVERGVVVAAAAGNAARGGPFGLTGEGMQISTPGVARGAITVGAGTKDDKLASFSSRGPTSDFRIKPDVLAPGVGINSSLPIGLMGRPYEAWSGTSMATPHVAGAAALLLQKGGIPPGWSKPQYIKDTLVSTAVVLNDPATGKPYSVFEQGGGRIDLASGAADTPILVDPATISLGFFYSSDTSSSTTLNFYNRDGAGHDLALSAVLTDVLSGADKSAAVSLDPAALAIPGGSGAPANLNIDLASLPAGAYEGRVTVTIDGTKTIHVIFSFVKFWKLTVNKTDINGQPAAKHPVFAFHDVYGSMESGPSYADGSGTVVFPVFEGVNQVWSWGWDDANKGVVVTVAENIDVHGDTTVNLDERNTVLIDFDPNKPDQVMAERSELLFYDSPAGWSMALGGSWWYPPSNKFRVSPISAFNASFTYGYYPKANFDPKFPDLVNSNERHNLIYSEDAISADKTYVADYATLAKRQNRYVVALNPEKAGWRMAAYDTISWLALSAQFYMKAPWGVQTEWLSPDPANYRTFYEKADPAGEWSYHTNNLKYAAGSETNFSMGRNPLNTGANIGIDFEKSAVNISGTISKDAAGNCFSNCHKGDPPMGALRVEVDSKTVVDRSIFDHFNQNVGFTGKPHIKVQIKGGAKLPLSGGSYTELEFTADPAQDSHPPEIVKFAAVDPYADLRNVVPGGPVHVRIWLKDDSPISQVWLQYSVDDGKNWSPAPLTDEGNNTWLADLGDLHDTFVTVAIGAEDNAGNRVHRNTFRGLYVGPPTPAGGWVVRLSASTTAAGGLQDPDNFAGVAPDAGDGYDANDAFNAPPPPQPYLDLLFPHPDWPAPYDGDYAKDIRPPADSIVWPVQVMNMGFGGEVQIPWDISQVPGSYQSVLLKDTVSGVTTDMRSNGKYVYTAAAGEVRDFVFSVGQKVTRSSSFPAGWNMFSLPLDIDPADWASQLGDDFSPLYVYHYDEVSHGYQMYPSTAFAAQRGWGYWLKALAAADVDVEGTIAAATPYSIHLLPGWMQIGHPFDFPMSWSEVQVRNTATGEVVSIEQAHLNGWVQKYLYNYDPGIGGYHMDTAPAGVLTPWLGYWVKALVEADLIVPATPVT